MMLLQTFTAIAQTLFGAYSSANAGLKLGRMNWYGLMTLVTIYLYALSWGAPAVAALCAVYSDVIILIEHYQAPTCSLVDTILVIVCVGIHGIVVTHFPAPLLVFMVKYYGYFGIANTVLNVIM